MKQTKRRIEKRGRREYNWTQLWCVLQRHHTPLFIGYLMYKLHYEIQWDGCYNMKLNVRVIWKL